MSETSENKSLIKFDPSRDNKGNKNAAMPYDEKLIRDELKTNVYRAVRGLNMTTEQADEYYTRPGVTVLERLFYDAAKAKQWSVLERFFDRTIGPPRRDPIEVDGNEVKPLNLGALSKNDLDTLRSLYRKLAPDNASAV